LTKATTGKSEAPEGREWLRGIYDSHRDLVFRYATSRVGREAAMDVVADTFVAAESSREAFDPSRGSEASWLLGIATNVIRRLRRSEGHGHVPLDERADSTGAEDPVLASLPGRLDAERQSGSIRRAVEDLPEGERAAILLHAVEGLSAAEVATALGIGRSAVKVRIFRARRRLREALSHLDSSKEES